MATDRSLATLLRALQSPTSGDDHDTSRLLASATTLLTLLSNPLNITLLTSHLLTAPAIWLTHDGIGHALQILSVFHSACRQIIARSADSSKRLLDSSQTEKLTPTLWARAVAKGADEKSPQWKHLLVLGGLLCGLPEEYGRDRFSGLRRNLGKAVVETANSALLGPDEIEDIAAGSICLALGHSLKRLGPEPRALIHGSSLLPVLTQQLLKSKHGLQWGYFLGMADNDVCQTSRQTFSWSPSSVTFYQPQKLSKSPLINSLGMLAQLWALCVEQTSHLPSIVATVDELAAFSRSLMVQWRQNKLSEIDRTEEAEFLDAQTLNTTMPLLWQVLRSVVFTSVVVLQSTLGRVLRDGNIPARRHISLSTQSLLIMRNLYFITSRLGHTAFDKYNFVYLAAIDILSREPGHAETFLTEIRPQAVAQIPKHPQDRCLDLFFFNTAEHFTLVLSTVVGESLFLSSAQPYLQGSIDPRLVDSFEAAHSLILSVFSAPQNATLVVQHVPAYINILLTSFPGNLSPQQFRLAIKTLVRIASPPHILSEAEPLLTSCILEAVYTKYQIAAQTHGTAHLPHPSDAGPDATLSEEAALLLTIIDAFPALSLDVLEYWLPVVGSAIQNMHAPATADVCRRRLWDMLSNGEMDVPRAELCLTWWNNKGGRQNVLGSEQVRDTNLMMSGALPELSKL